MIYEHSFQTDEQQLMEMQTKLWKIIDTFPNPKDRLKLAGVALKVTIQLYQSAMAPEAIEKMLVFASRHLDSVEPLISQDRTVH